MNQLVQGNLTFFDFVLWFLVLFWFNVLVFSAKKTMFQQKSGKISNAPPKSVQLHTKDARCCTLPHAPLGGIQILFSSSSFNFNWRWHSLSKNSHSVLPEVIYSGGVALNMINGSLQKILKTTTFYLLFLRLRPMLRKLNLHFFTHFLDFIVVLYFH